MKRKEDMINELKPPALQRIQDSWKLELGDVYHKHKEFIKGVEKCGLSASGMIFFITPTSQFLLGYFYYNHYQNLR